LADWITTAFELFKQRREDVDILDKLLSAGCRRDVSEKLLMFLPQACARAFLSDLGIVFPPNYRCVLPDGSLGAQRPFNSDPDWVAIEAFVVARKSTEKDEIARIGTRSSEFDAINKALLNGSKPSNLVLSDSVFAFTEASGLSGATAQAAKKPWWRFWR
jgi:hypothetical protein